jgi:hypothetical protein
MLTDFRVALTMSYTIEHCCGDDVDIDTLTRDPDMRFIRGQALQYSDRLEWSRPVRIHCEELADINSSKQLRYPRRPMCDLANQEAIGIFNGIGARKNFLLAWFDTAENQTKKVRLADRHRAVTCMMGCIVSTVCEKWCNELGLAEAARRCAAWRSRSRVLLQCTAINGPEVETVMVNQVEAILTNCVKR